MFSRGRSSIALCLSCGVLTALLAALCSPAMAAASAALAPGGRPSMAFEPNQGQADPAVKFLARGRGYGLFLTPTETLLVLVPQDRGGLSGRRPGAVAAPMPPPRIVRMRLEGADENSRLVGVDQRTGRSHYLVGQPGQWRRDVPTFARVHYAGVYPGVSLEFYGTERQLEYDFVVAPGGDPHAVVMAFEGAEALRLQEVDGGRRPVEGGYVLDGARVRFWVAAWDASRPLVIDPVLGYSTYLGGTSTDLGFGVVLDQAGNAYITGSTISSDFPVTPGALDPVRTGVTDVFVSKIDPTGTTLLYSTFLGGSGDDVGNAIAVDSAGNAYVAGNTTSNNFPVVGAFQSTTRGGNEAFVAKLAPNGSSLVYSTYLGSNGNAPPGERTLLVPLQRVATIDDISEHRDGRRLELRFASALRDIRKFADQHALTSRRSPTTTRSCAPVSSERAPMPSSSSWTRPAQPCPIAHSSVALAPTPATPLLRTSPATCGWPARLPRLICPCSARSSRGSGAAPTASSASSTPPALWCISRTSAEPATTRRWPSPSTASAMPT